MSIRLTYRDDFSQTGLDSSPATSDTNSLAGNDDNALAVFPVTH
nr:MULTISPECIES: hypothetical protein [unclassified Halomonas]